MKRLDTSFYLDTPCIAIFDMSVSAVNNPIAVYSSRKYV